MESTAQLIIINECFMPATIQPRPALSDLFLHRRLPAISQRQPFEWKWNFRIQRKFSTRKPRRRVAGTGENFTLATSGHRAETILSNEHMLRNTEGIANELWGESTIFYFVM